MLNTEPCDGPMTVCTRTPVADVFVTLTVVVDDPDAAAESVSMHAEVAP